MENLLVLETSFIISTLSKEDDDGATVSCLGAGQLADGKAADEFLPMHLEMQPNWAVNFDMILNECL